MYVIRNNILKRSVTTKGRKPLVFKSLANALHWHKLNGNHEYLVIKNLEITEFNDFEQQQLLKLNFQKRGEI